jgi:hypothetical protein
MGYLINHLTIQLLTEFPSPVSILNKTRHAERENFN